METEKIITDVLQALADNAIISAHNLYSRRTLFPPEYESDIIENVVDEFIGYINSFRDVAIDAIKNEETK